MKQALVGMSGGVDSSVAAYLVREAGYDVTGATMRLYDNETIGVTSRTCCSLSSIEDACQVASKLGIAYVVYDMRQDFRETVRGGTPNPCIECNKHLKFDRLYELAARDLIGRSDSPDVHPDDQELYVATGHYAVIEKLPSGRYALKKGADPAKDQS